MVVTPGATMKPASKGRPPAAPFAKSDSQPIDPELTKRDLSNAPGYAEAIKAWMRFRFVRAGWFSPQEAIEYID